MNISEKRIKALNKKYKSALKNCVDEPLLEEIRQLRIIIWDALAPDWVNSLKDGIKPPTYNTRPILFPEITTRKTEYFPPYNPDSPENLLERKYRILDETLAKKEKEIRAQLDSKETAPAKELSVKKNKLSLPEIGVLCYYNGRKVTTNNDIAIAKEYGKTTGKHMINTWYNNVSGNSYKPEFIERRIALHHIHRLEHILESGYLKADKIKTVEKDIVALKKVAENKK